MKHILTLLALTTTLALAAPAKPAPVILGPALTALGAKFEANWQFKEPALILKTDASLSEEAWKEITTLTPQRVSAGGKGIDDAALIRFSKLPLEQFSTDGSTITDEGTAAFAQMKQLIKVRISHNMQLKTVPGLAAHPTLQIVNIGGTSVGDGALPGLASIKTLRELSLHHCLGVTDAGVVALAKHPALEKLTLDPQFRPIITDAAIAPLATIPNLKDLSINETVLSYAGVSQLKAAKSLTKLTLQKNGIPTAEVDKLKAELPKVEIKYEPAEATSIAKWTAAKEKAAKH